MYKRQESREFVKEKMINIILILFEQHELLCKDEDDVHDFSLV